METRTDCVRAGNETRPARTAYASHGQKPRAAPLEGGASGGGPSHERTLRGERPGRRSCGLTRDSNHHVVWATGRPIRGRGRATPPAPAPPGLARVGVEGGTLPVLRLPPADRSPPSSPPEGGREGEVGRNAPRPRPSRCRGPGGGGVGGAGREAGLRGPGPWVWWAIALAALNTAGAVAHRPVVPQPLAAPGPAQPRLRHRGNPD